MKRTNPRAMIATTFLIVWFITTVMLYGWNLASGGDNYRTPFTEMMRQAGCIPVSYVNGSLESFNVTNCQTVNSSSLTQNVTDNMFSTSIGIILGATILGALVSVIFPNVWGIFAAFTMVFMWWISYPLSILGSQNMPFPITFLIYSFYFVSAIAVVSWYKGGDLP